MEDNEDRDVNQILDKWLNLQKIIKEEITINEIITRQQHSNIEALKLSYYEYYDIRLKIRETFENNKKIETQQFTNFVLSKDTDKYLLEVYDPIQRLLFVIRNNDKYLLHLIENLEESKENYDTIVELVCHQLYENLLIQNPEHSELLSLIYKLIHKEVYQMNSARVTSFLDDNSTFIGKLLKSYTKRQDMKTFITMIFSDIILNIEKFSDNCLDMEVTRISSYLKDRRMNQNINKSYSSERSKNILNKLDSEVLTRPKVTLSKDDVSFSKSMIEKTNIKIDSLKKEEFIYGFDDVRELCNDENFIPMSIIEATQDELTFRLSNEKDSNMKDFYMRQLERITKDPDIFTNKKLISTLSSMSEGGDVLIKYKENFDMIKSFLDNIISSLINNVSIIPYTVRCMCKIINILIFNKFPNVNKYERNAFIGEFIFGKCIIPILINPDYESVISSTIISINTKRCLKTIAKVLIKLNRGNLFESYLDTDYTIFNQYIIEVIQDINKFYDKLIDVKLPKSLDLIIKENGNLKYDFFNWNKDELIHIQSICFSIQDVLTIVKNLKPKSDLFKSDNIYYKSLEKIYNQEIYLTQLIRNDPFRKFFLIFNITNNPELVNLLYPKVFKFTFNSAIENSQFIVNQIKFCIKLILRSLNMLNLKVYSHFSNANTTENFFEALNQIIQLEEYNEIEFNEKIPINWYSLYMTSNIQFLSDEYKKNDYARLYNEILNEEKKEIEFLNSKNNLIVTRYGMNMRCIEKIIENIRRYFNKVKQIQKYLKIEYFLKNTSIDVCIRLNTKEEPEDKSTFFDYIFFRTRNKTVVTEESDDKEYCTILIKKTDECIHKKLQYIEKLTDGKPEKKSAKGKVKNEENKLSSHASNIIEFIKIFSKFNEIKDDIISGDQKHKIYKSLSDYMEIVKDYYNKNDLFKIYDHEETDEILEDIENFILKKIHKYVYPPNALSKDREFFERTCKLSWITPNHLDINKKYINEKLWHIAINNLNKMDEEKSPYLKLKSVLSSYKILNNCIAFCSGKEDAGADDIVPIFVYIIVKSKPKRIFSNLSYIKSLVNPDKFKANYGYILSQIEMGTEFIMSINNEMLKMSNEEFLKNMESFEDYQY